MITIVFLHKNNVFQIFTSLDMLNEKYQNKTTVSTKLDKDNIIIYKK